MKRFVFSESGWVSVLSVLFTIACLIIMGLAIDVNNLVREKTRLQVVADNTAHAALYMRERNDATVAKAQAIELANAQMPTTRYGIVLETEDIQFGTWSIADRVFTIDPDSTSAVLVTTERFEIDGNGVATFLFKLIGQDIVDVQAQSVFMIERPNCLNEGFVAEGTIDMQSNNTFTDGFCIHSNTQVEFNSGNVLEPGVIVSVPNAEDDVTMPTSGCDQNEGLCEAILGNQYYNLRILNWLPDIIQSFKDGGSTVSADFTQDDSTTWLPNYTSEDTAVSYLPDYITNTTVVTSFDTNPDISTWEQGRIYHFDCGGSGTLYLGDGTMVEPDPTSDSTIDPDADTIIEQVIVVTDCNIQFKSFVVVRDAIIATSSTDKNRSVASSSGGGGLQLGSNDDCALGGGAQLLTEGTFKASASFQIYGGQVIALKDIIFASQASGVKGASFIAGGEIDGPSLTTMGFCDGDGLEDNLALDVFRLAG